MKANREIRQSARTILKGKWLWRLSVVGLCLYSIQNLALQTLNALYEARGIPKMADHLQAKLAAWQQGMVSSLPNAEARWQMLGSFAFELFITYIFASIVAYGFARTLIKSTANDEERWFADSFDGFRRPLETAWLMALMNIRVTLWSLLLIVPGVVALYRYRLAWYLKSDHPDWSAARCLSESGRMMRGRKGQAFGLDLSYMGWFMLAALALGVGNVLAQQFGESGPLSFVAFAASTGGTVAMILVLVYFMTARAVFYDEVKGAQEAEREQGEEK